MSATDVVVASRPDLRPARDGGPRAHGRGPPPRRAVRGALPGDRRLLDRDAAAGQARPGARPRPAPALPRRADERPRPGRARRDARADPPDRHGVRDRGDRRLAPARRDRAGLRPPRRDRGREARFARRRSAPSRSGRARWPSRSRTARTRLAERLTAAGLHAIVDGSAVLIDLVDERPYDLVRDTIAELGLPLVRLEQRRHRLEDLFRDGPDGEPANGGTPARLAPGAVPAPATPAAGPGTGEAGR